MASRAARLDEARKVLTNPRPQLMAIGDSLFNGTRSMTTTPILARQSVPVRVARGLGLTNFVFPDYPRAMIVDLEAIVRRYKAPDLLSRIDQIKAEIIANADAWLADGAVWSNRRAFDNIAAAGETVAGLLDRTASQARAKAKEAYDRLKAAKGLGAFLVAASDLYVNLNAAFLLNPRRLAELDHLSQADMAVARAPRRLLVSIGANDGYVSAIFSGGSDAIAPIRKPLLQALERLAVRLKGLPDDCDIYFNLLMKPSVSANLSPQNDRELLSPPGCGKYFTSGYYSKIADARAFTKSAMAKYDADISGLNNDIQKTMRDGIGPALRDKLHFVDLYAFVKRFDSKHCPSAEKIEVIQGNGNRARLGNTPITYDIVNDVIKGGFFGLDNLHPTGVGYQLFANTILQRIDTAEADIDPVYGSIQKAFEDDELLSNFPQNWFKPLLPPVSYKYLARVAGGLGLISMFGSGGEKVARRMIKDFENGDA